MQRLAAKEERARGAGRAAWPGMIAQGQRSGRGWRPFCTSFHCLGQNSTVTCTRDSFSQPHSKLRSLHSFVRGGRSQISPLIEVTAHQIRRSVTMATGLDQLKHIVVLMMENRSFDHMLGSLKADNPAIDGITNQLSNPDTTGALIKPQPLAEFQSQLDPDPDHHFPAVDLQIFGGNNSAGRAPNMQGFVKSYFNQQRDVKHSQKIMYYFPKEKLPVLTTLALEFAVFNRWFASIPGPTICNRAFAHYGTSFGRVDLNPLYINEPFKSIYSRLIGATPKRTAKVYYYDTTSSTMEVANLLQNQPELFGTFDQFEKDCKKGDLPDYAFIEPNYSDHDTNSGEEIANDQHPDHNVQAGELFIAAVYQRIKDNPQLWAT